MGLSGFVTVVLWPTVRGVLAEEEVYTGKTPPAACITAIAHPKAKPRSRSRLNAKPIAVQPTERIFTLTDNAGRGALWCPAAVRH